MCAGFTDIFFGTREHSDFITFVLRVRQTW